MSSPLDRRAQRVLARTEPLSCAQFARVREARAFLGRSAA